MSFFKCCVGADPRPPPEAIRPVHASNRRNAGNDISNGAAAGKKKTKMPTEVFFDPTKPDGQLSSITDPPNSTRENPDSKKKKETKERSGQQRDHRKSNGDKDKADMDAHDNNGLTRGQNFMKVEKWLRQACKYQQVSITPGEITNIEDGQSDLPDSTADPPSEKDRLPASTANAHRFRGDLKRGGRSYTAKSLTVTSRAPSRTAPRSKSRLAVDRETKQP